MRTLQKYHPVTMFLYFTIVLAVTMLTAHPVFIGISFVCAAVTVLACRQKTNVLYLIPTAILTALFNPLFNHRGASVLAYFPNGNPLTAESVAYGIAAAVMLMGVLLWFVLLHRAMTTDKWMCLFGRAAPSLALMLSMALRFVPHILSRIKATAQAQRCMGHTEHMEQGAEQTGLRQRVRSGTRVLSAVITRALDDAVTTADSMKSRGYGTGRRTSYSIFRFSRRDAALCLWLLVLGGGVLLGVLTGAAQYFYFPTLRTIEWTPLSMTSFGAYFLLCITPVMLEMGETIQWKIIRSKI